MTVLSILKKVPLFKSISEKDLGKIKSILREKRFKKGEYIFSETEEGNEFYIVYEGRVKIYKVSNEGQIKALDYLEKGNFFGEMALLDRNLRSANALAMEDSCLFTINHRDFQEFLISQPKILISITQTLCQRLRKADHEIELFSFSNVKDRLITCLINLSEKYGEETSEGIKVTMKFTHKDLSELVGTAREVITRIMKDLKEEKLLKSTKSGFIIPSLIDLRKKIAD
ncbi:Crp/Fnr family transcriptional regulator [Elusimicrobiota bacterium]